MEKKTQKAGNDSLQIQAGTVNIGIDEKRVREIFDEKIKTAVKELSEEASIIAFERIKTFEDQLINKIAKLEDGLKSFGDPNFQLNLIEAQKTAAGTERSADYDLLSELLIHLVKKGENRETRTGIKKAIEIVGDISDEALLGLTTAHVFLNFVPMSGNIYEGLEILNDMFSNIISNTLPNGVKWIDHLDILNAVRINQISRFPNMRTILSNNFSGYIDIGLRKKSLDYEQAIAILKSVDMHEKDLLVEHSLNTDFVRLNIENINSISDLYIEIKEDNDKIINKKISKEQQDALKSVYKLYDNSEVLKQQNIVNFLKKWESYTSLKMISDWWDKIPYYFSITAVGGVIAHANAQNCIPDFPAL